MSNLEESDNSLNNRIPYCYICNRFGHPTESCRPRKITNLDYKELHEVALAMREWIDAVPLETVLPSMPGFDRDWADSVLRKEY